MMNARNNARRGTWGLPLPVKPERRHMTYTVSVWRKTQSNKQKLYLWHITFSFTNVFNDFGRIITITLNNICTRMFLQTEKNNASYKHSPLLHLMFNTRKSGRRVKIADCNDGPSSFVKNLFHHNFKWHRTST
jgi:hypothetical protein